MLVICDASQLEWRVAVELSGDKVGQQEIVHREDAHSKNQVAFKLPSRLIAKIYLFRTIFRGSGYAFANDPEFMHVSASPKYWDNVGVMFYEKYFGLDNWHKYLAELVSVGKKVVTPFGREWFIPLGTDSRGELKLPWTVFTNYPVQGTAADLMSVARVSFAQRFKQSKIQGKLISTVHDNIIVDLEDIERLQDLVNLLFQVFDDLPLNVKKLFGYVWKTPLDCEVKYGMTMHDMEKIGRTDKTS